MAEERVVRVVIRLRKLPLSLTRYKTREIRPCILSGKHNAANTVGADVGEPDQGREQGGAVPITHQSCDGMGVKELPSSSHPSHISMTEALVRTGPEVTRLGKLSVPPISWKI